MRNIAFTPPSFRKPKMSGGVISEVSVEAEPNELVPVAETKGILQTSRL